ncbi:hypothetical protein A9Z42_0076890 [Trichoderma parareesei]|uniref:Uncharacterized protein n=1 Tax=Trichoderma parareesei TaxID=858221 RepID=A0A2H2ZJ72_TRIPA|nr:hypothetical protein A9Z42_0076890 [Trichoderma parareesei]
METKDDAGEKAEFRRAGNDERRQISGPGRQEKDGDGDGPKTRRAEAASPVEEVWTRAVQWEGRGGAVRLWPCAPGWTRCRGVRKTGTKCGVHMCEVPGSQLQLDDYYYSYKEQRKQQQAERGILGSLQSRPDQSVLGGPGL